MTPHTQIVLCVTGGRDLTPDSFASALPLLGNVSAISLHHGDARGWDRAARDWARSNGIPDYPVPFSAGEAEGVPRAQWGKRRNWTFMANARRQARENGVSCVCLAGWNGMSGGTAHGIATATSLGLDVVLDRAWEAKR